MTDIVERLRDADYNNAPSRCMEAAREIERLRAALKALVPDEPAWDAGWNRNYEPVETRAAEIYATFNYAGPGDKPAWVRGGNSNRQDDARHDARRELREAGHSPAVSRPNPGGEA